jgi:hypothetical protein
MDAAQWVYDTVAKMDPDEARMFALFVADDLHINEIANNQRALSAEYDRVQKSISDDLAPYFLRELNKGADPEVLVAQAAAVAVAKSNFTNDWYMYQQRDHGKFGRMTRGQYKAQAEQIKAGQKSDYEDLKALKRGYVARGGRATAHMADTLHQPVRDFESRFNERPSNESQATDTMRRMGATGNLVSSLGIATGKPSVVAAGQLASIAGMYGPEAEKVIGPSMRKTAYRYRGTERTPDKNLQAYQKHAAAQLNRNEGRPASTPLKPNEKVYASHQAAVNYMLGLGTQNGEPARSRVPSAKMANLHRQAGRVTPSEGIMIDAEGNTIAQAVGFGEDHYLPFNLKNLGGLKGGSYVRTRESGGLTSEDIYAGLLSGARSVSVVSNSGVFTLHFDDDLRGGRRYNDKAKQMVGRYEHLLDAVKSENVKNPERMMSPETKARIRQETEDEFAALDLHPSKQEMEGYVEQAITEAAKKPQLTPEQKTKLDKDVADITQHEGEAAARRFKYEKEDELLTDNAGQNYRLDGEGYQAAMQALKEQFPYYIDDVESTTRNKVLNSASGIPGSRFHAKPDQGYVKPRYNRPEGARAGYFDTTITGEGKRGADKTNYQNWRARGPERKTSEGDTATTPATTPASSPREQARQIQDRQRDADKQDRLKTATKHDANLWLQTHEAVKATNNAGVISSIRHPLMDRYRGMSEAERESFLDSDEAPKLRGEIKTLLDAHGGTLRAKNPGFSADDFDEIGLVERQTAKPKWDDSKLASHTAPESPMGLDTDQLKTVAGDKDLLELSAKSDEELKTMSNQARTNRRQADIRMNGPHVKQYDAEVKRIEQARALKVSRPPEPKTAVETKPATTAVDTKPDAHAAFENEVKRANSISDRFDRAEALDRLQEDEHGLFSGVPNDEKEAVLQRHRRN